MENRRAHDDPDHHNNNIARKPLIFKKGFKKRENPERREIFFGFDTKDIASLETKKWKEEVLTVLQNFNIFMVYETGYLSSCHSYIILKSFSVQSLFLGELNALNITNKWGSL